MNDVYNPGQLLQVAKLLKTPPKWMVLGGPSNANEAQTAVSTWPAVRVLGVEPNEDHATWQLDNGWPRGHPLLPAALTDADGLVVFHPIEGTSGGTLLDLPTELAPRTVTGVTLDTLDREYGPFEDVLLWLDVEGSEAATLRGASGLLASGRVLAVSVEVCDRTPRVTDEIASILTAAGLVGPTRWASSPPAYHDELWVRG